MDVAVGKPNLNRGMDAGLRQESFGIRGGNMAFPAGMSKSQPPPTTMSNPTLTQNYPLLPVDSAWDSEWDTGTFLFIKKDSNQLKQIFCLPFARTLMTQAGILRNRAMRKAVTDAEQAEIAARGGTTNGNFQSNGVLKSFTKSNARDYSFMGDMETIAKDLEFLGIAIGPADPSQQVGTLDMNGSTKYSGSSKQLPVVVNGHIILPNLWDVNVRAGQDLYIIIKPRLLDKQYFDPSGNLVAQATDNKVTDTVPDVIFYTNPHNKPPPYHSDNTALSKLTGGQPPLYDRAWIEWICDAQGKIIRGELRDGLVWRIGRVYNTYTVRSVTHGRLNNTPSAPLPFAKNYNKAGYEEIEIMVDSKRIY